MSLILLFLICFHAYGAESWEQSPDKIVLSKIRLVFDKSQNQIKDMSYNELKRFTQSIVDTVKDVGAKKLFGVQEFLDNHRAFSSNVSRFVTEKENLPPLNQDIFDFHKREAMRYLLFSAYYLCHEQRVLHNFAYNGFCEHREACYTSATEE